MKRSEFKSERAIRRSFPGGWKRTEKKGSDLGYAGAISPLFPKRKCRIPNRSDATGAGKQDGSVTLPPADGNLGGLNFDLKVHPFHLKVGEVDLTFGLKEGGGEKQA